MIILDFWGYWLVSMFGLIMGLCIGYWIGVAKTEPEYDWPAPPAPKPETDDDAVARRLIKSVVFRKDL